MKGLRRSAQPANASTGLARALSKLGYCSRAQARELIQSGRVRLNGAVRRDPEQRVALGHDKIAVDNQSVKPEARVYLMLNKPRGLVTTASDEKGRPTVFDCLRGHDLPFVSPVGRLDQASEGLLLFTNDTAWAATISDPCTHLDKIYHVQINQVLDEPSLQRLKTGIELDAELLSVKDVKALRVGGKNSWLEIVLDEGRNRQIRRLLEAEQIEVLRLIRIAIGPLQLGSLAKAAFRRLTAAEVAALVA